MTCRLGSTLLDLPGILALYSPDMRFRLYARTSLEGTARPWRQGAKNSALAGCMVTEHAERQEVTPCEGILGFEYVLIITMQGDRKSILKKSQVLFIQ